MEPCPRRECPYLMEREALREEREALQETLANLGHVVTELRITVTALNERVTPLTRGFWGAIAFVLSTVGGALLYLVVRR